MTNWSEARKLIEDGDVIFFSKGKRNFVRRAITWFSRGDYYHVGIAFWAKVESTEPRLMLAESQPDGFRIINLGAYQERDMTAIRTSARWEDMAPATIDGAGAISYDLADLVAIGLHERFGVPLPKSSGPGLVCSSVVSNILQGAGIGGIDTMLSPQRLFEQLSARFPVFVIIRK